MQIHASELRTPAREQEDEVILSHNHTNYAFLFLNFLCLEGFYISKEGKKSSVENYEILLHANLIKITVSVNAELKKMHFPGPLCSCDHV